MKLGIGAVPFGPKVSINLELNRRAEERVPAIISLCSVNEPSHRMRR